jgi:hypothetical protein
MDYRRTPKKSRHLPRIFVDKSKLVLRAGSRLCCTDKLTPSFKANSLLNKTREDLKRIGLIIEEQSGYATVLQDWSPATTIRSSWRPLYYLTVGNIDDKIRGRRRAKHWHGELTVKGTSRTFTITSWQTKEQLQNQLQTSFKHQPQMGRISMQEPFLHTLCTLRPCATAFK